MTQTNTDYLFQFTRPVADRNVAPPANGDGDKRFDDHLSQASAGPRDDSNHDGANARGSNTTVDRGRQANHDSKRVEGTRNTSRTSSEGKTKSRAVKSRDDRQSTNAQNERPASSDKVESDDHKDDDSTSSSAPKYGTVEQVVASNSPAPDSTSCMKTESVAVEAENIAVDSLANTSETDNQSQPANTQPIENIDVTAPLQVPANAVTVVDAVSAAAVTSTEATTVNESVQTQSPTEKEDATEKPSDSTETVSATNSATGITQPNATSATLDAQANASTDAAQNTTTPTPPTAVAPNSDQSKSTTASDDASKDDSRLDAQSDSTDDTSNSAPIQPNKAPIVPVVNVSAAVPSDSTATAKPNDEKNESSIKPVTSKNETSTIAFARLTRAGGGINRGEQTANGEMPPIDPARFVSRVAKAFQTAHERGGTLQIRLSPPELGSLRLEMTVKNGVMSASLQTENANARRLLLDHLPALRDRLAEQNIRVDRFDVDVRQDGAGGQANARGSQQQAFQHQPEQPAQRRPAAPQVQPRKVARTEPAPVTPTITDAGLNLIV
jgi:flagellar hook-length control protein FliK